MLALGREGDESAQGGVEVEVKAGDVIVVPAGVSHRSLNAENYRYIGVYPKVLLSCPRLCDNIGSRVSKLIC